MGDLSLCVLFRIVTRNSNRVQKREREDEDSDEDQEASLDHQSNAEQHGAEHDTAECDTYCHYLHLKKRMSARGSLWGVAPVGREPWVMIAGEIRTDLDKRMTGVTRKRPGFVVSPRVGQHHVSETGTKVSHTRG